MAETSDFKFGVQLAFAKSHRKIPPRRKEGRGPKLGELPNIWGFPLIFVQWLKVLTSNLVHRVVANLAHHKITQMTKVGLGYGMVRSLQN